MPVARFPSLAHWGAFTAVVENGRLVDCEPFARDPAPSEMLKSMPGMVHSPLRVARPAIREGWRECRPRTGHDSFREVSWDEALDTVAAELARVRGSFGPSAILGGSHGWSSAGRVHHARGLVRRFMFLGGGCVDQVGNYSFGAAYFLLPHVIGSFAPVMGQNTDWSSIVGHTRLILAFGGLAAKNGQVTSGGAGAHSMDGWLHRARAAGIEFVSISPLRSDSPDFLGAQWVPIRPNTDTALMLGMAHTLLVEERHDAQFVARHCAGFETFRRYLLGSDDGLAKDADWAAAITGVAAETIRELARRAAASRSMLTCSWSLQRAQHGEQPYWAAITLAAMLGGIGLPGGGFGFGHGSINGVGVPRIDVAGPEVPLPLNPARIAIPCSRVADMLLNPGESYAFNGRRYTYPDIRLIYWAGGNPFHHQQDLYRLQRAWQKPETVIVHEAWWTPTARHADIVLPATTTLERNDVGGSSRDSFILAMHRAIDPVGEARNDFDILRALARRLGYETAFTADRDELGWCQWVYDAVRASAAKKGVELPGFQQFWAEGFVELPPPDRDYVLFENFRRDPERHPLKTRSGRIEIASAAIGEFGYPDCPPHPTWLEPKEWLGSAEAARHPLHLVTHQPDSRLHSQMDPGALSRARKVSGREAVRLHPADAARRGIADGDIVRVYNSRGACLAGAVLDAGVMTGVAVMATGAWFDPPRRDASSLPSAPSVDEVEPERHGNPNVLTLDIGSSALAQAPSALTALVEVERWAQPELPVRAFTPPELIAAE
ncbi:MAG TPA: molybdopterin-dependent oxidoreductase [Xanthobacteraceae bacterium]|jgi:biotin/methionine sulfoxide reductase